LYFHHGLLVLKQASLKRASETSQISQYTEFMHAV
jgi:hypothetical protein